MTASAPSLTSLPPRHRVSELERIFETDRLYFEMGARIMPLPGAKLVWMSGLAAIASGAVIQRVCVETVSRSGARWLAMAEGALHRIGASFARIYFDKDSAAADPLLRTAGYQRRTELAFAGALEPSVPRVTLLPVRSEADWARKVRFHEDCNERPDGHASSAAQWVELERRKCGAGMETFLAECQGEIVGSVSLLLGEGLLRMKNVAIHPNHRRRSFGSAMLGALAEHGERRGIRRQCIFGVLGSPGERLYRSVGLQPIGSCTEWVKNLGARDVDPDP